MTTKEYPIIVYCPKCKQRLFDMSTPSEGLIEIKCKKCTRVIAVDLKTNQRTVK